MSIKLHTELLPYQKEGVDTVKKIFRSVRNSFLIADEPGLGKTIMSLSLIAGRYKKGKTAVICPAFLKSNWVEKIDSFLKVKKDDIDYIEYSSQVLRSSARIAILSYDTFVSRNATFPSSLVALGYDFFIFDESHYLKNDQAKRTQCVKKWVKRLRENEKSSFFLLLTGTPITSSIADLYSAIDIFAPSLVSMGKWAFFYKFAERIDTTQWGSRVVGVKDELGLRNMLKTFMIRRKKEDVLKDLPALTRSPIFLDSEDVIKQVKSKSLKNILKKEEEFLASVVFTDGGEARRQVLKTTEIDYTLPLHVTRERMALGIAKIEYIIPKLVERFTNKRLLIFCSFKVTALLACELLGKDKTLLVTGSIPPDQRKEMVDLFYKETKYRYLVSTIRALSEGVDITCVDTVAFLEIDWNHTSHLQAEGRLHRVGQKEKVLSVYYTLDKGIDRHVYGKMLEKKNTFDKVFN